MMILGTGLLLLIAVSAFFVVRTDDATCQVIALSFYGLLYALMFFIFQAPDVALSQLTIGAIALPLMVMLALTRMKHKEALRRQQRKQHD
jgi:energy-converting hydrogenase B subunit D